MKTEILIGWEAIEAAEKDSKPLLRVQSAVGEEMGPIGLVEARTIAQKDPSLIYAYVALDESVPEEFLRGFAVGAGLQNPIEAYQHWNRYNQGVSRLAISDEESAGYERGFEHGRKYSQLGVASP